MDNYYLKSVACAAKDGDHGSGLTLVCFSWKRPGRSMDECIGRK